MNELYIDAQEERVFVVVGTETIETAEVFDDDDREDMILSFQWEYHIPNSNITRNY